MSMSSTSPLVAIIHATPATFGPVETAFTQEFPGAQLWHLLDDRLVTDADRAGGLTPALHARMGTLIEYAVSGGAEAVQLACSMYGPVAAARAVDSPVPVLAADQAMFDDVAARAPRRVVVLASLESAAADSVERLRTTVGGAVVEARVVPGARDAVAAGDHAALVAVLSDALRALGDDVDVVVLAQYSLTPVVAELRALTGVPVLSGPHLAAVTLSRRLGGVS
jgi:Asp/Glu/hydantoin racemase